MRFVNKGEATCPKAGCQRAGACLGEPRRVPSGMKGYEDTGGCKRRLKDKEKMN